MASAQQSTRRIFWATGVAKTQVWSMIAIRIIFQWYKTCYREIMPTALINTVAISYKHEKHIQQKLENVPENYDF